MSTYCPETYDQSMNLIYFMKLISFTRPPPALVYLFYLATKLIEKTTQ